MIRKSIFIFVMLLGIYSAAFAKDLSAPIFELTPSVISQYSQKANSFFVGLINPISFLDVFLQKFDELDRNKDGKISRYENFFKIKFTIGLNKIFKSLDTNNDGYITKDEIIAGEKDAQELFKINFYIKWMELDEDNDSFISLEEAKVSKILLNKFHIIDTNSDGKLSKNELIEYYNHEIMKIF